MGRIFPRPRKYHLEREQCTGFLQVTHVFGTAVQSKGELDLLFTPVLLAVLPYLSDLLSVSLS